MFRRALGFCHERSCKGCGKVEIKATISELPSIPLERIQEAALNLATSMDTIRKSQMIDTDSIRVRCDGTVHFKLQRLDDQNNEDERWDEQYQPLTTAKVTADCARTLLTKWQRSMLFTYRKDPEKVVFLAEDLDSLEKKVTTGDKVKVLRAIAAIRTTEIKTLDSKLRY
jgi:hypothetical protein